MIRDDNVKTEEKTGYTRESVPGELARVLVLIGGRQLAD